MISRPARLRDMSQASLVRHLPCRRRQDSHRIWSARSTHSKQMKTAGVGPGRVMHGCCHLDASHHPEVALGGFKTVDLNIVGWLALLGPGVAVGGAVAVVADLPVLPVIVAGMIAAFFAGRILDDLADRRRYGWVPVVESAQAEAQLREAGIRAFGATSADVDGRRVEYVAVRERDHSFASELVGLPHESRRARRRWEKARRASVRLPAPR